MADASVTYDIKGTSDVQEQTDKAKKSMGQMENAIEGLNKKMSNWGKDLVLSYIAPMVLLNKAIDYIAQKIEEQRAAVKEAMEFAKKGDSAYLSPETVYLARKFAEDERIKKEKEMAKTSKEETTSKYIEEGGRERRDKIMNSLPMGRMLRLQLGLDANSAEAMGKEKDVQRVVDNMIAGDMAKAQVKQNQTGYDNIGVQNAVFGMGTSPLIGAMNEQLEQQRRQTALLERIADNQPITAGDDDYTKSLKNPSRSTPYGL